MPLILLTNYYEENILQIVRQNVPNGFDILPLEKPSREDIISKAPHAEYFLAGGRIKIDKDILNAAVKLKMIQRTGVGTDIFDFNLLKDMGIPLYINQGVNAKSVAEHTITLILSVLRRLPEADYSVRKGLWPKHELGLTTKELNGKIVGLIGLGHIGSEVAKMLKPFGVSLVYFDTHRKSIKIEQELNVRYCSFHDLLSSADIVSLHCPFTADTQRIIGGKELSVMKDGAILINTARGSLVDEEALIKSLTTGHLAAAGIDVFSKEPPDVKNKLLYLKNVVLTPHMGGVTFDAFSRMMKEGFQNIACFDAGEFSVIESKKVQL